MHQYTKYLPSMTNRLTISQQMVLGPRSVTCHSRKKVQMARAIHNIHNWFDVASGIIRNPKLPFEEHVWLQCVFPFYPSCCRGHGSMNPPWTSWDPNFTMSSNPPAGPGSAWHAHCTACISRKYKYYII